MAIRRDAELQQRRDAHQPEDPLLSLAEPPAPCWAKWRVDYWDKQASNWRLWKYARDTADRGNLGNQCRALGHLVRYKAIPSFPPTVQVRSPVQDLEILDRFRRLLSRENAEGRLLLPRDSWMEELGVALSRAVGFAHGASRSFWKQEQFQAALERQEKICELIEVAVCKRRVPSPGSARWAWLERLVSSIREAVVE